MQYTGRFASMLFLFAGIFTLIIGMNRCKDGPAVLVREPPFKNSATVIRLDSSELPVDSLIAKVNTLMKLANVQGLGMTIINNNEVVFQDYFGMRNVEKNESFTPGNIWYGASLSKTIFADVMLQLDSEKVFSLDTPLYRYLPRPLPEYDNNKFQVLLGADDVDYSDLENDQRYKSITGRMCLSHTTGLPNWRWIEDDGRLKIKFDPGTRYSYSGEGMYLLQIVVEKITGKSFEDLARDRVFIPLKMSSSSFVWQDAYEGNHVVGHSRDGANLGIHKRDRPNAAGSMSTSLEDYTRFFQAVLRQDKDRYRQMISPVIRIRSKQQFGPNSHVETEDNDSISLAYGLGFGLYESPFGHAFFKEGHDDGWQHYAVGFPEKRTALIMMTNSDQGESIFRELNEYILANKSMPWYWEGYIPYDMKK
jgi:serine-type D-Ala-D-Ala carboxypeptidase/endopeptidase